MMEWDLQRICSLVYAIFLEDQWRQGLATMAYGECALTKLTHISHQSTIYDPFREVQSDPVRVLEIVH